jgi:hypothetical protein
VCTNYIAALLQLCCSSVAALLQLCMCTNYIALSTLMPQLLDKMRGLVRKVAEKKPQLLNKFFLASAIKSLDEHKVKVKKKNLVSLLVRVH